MKLELNIKRLDNEDVIATSCGSVYGVADMFFKSSNSNYVENVYKNDDGFKFNYGSIYKPEGFDGDGWYHVDKNGNIIEKCPHFQDTEAVKEAHNITIGN